MVQHQYSIGTVPLFPRKGIHAIPGTTEKRWSYVAKGNSNIISKIAGRNLASIMKSENGDEGCFNTVVFIFIAVLLLAFILDLFSIKIGRAHV